MSPWGRTVHHGTLGTKKLAPKNHVVCAESTMEMTKLLLASIACAQSLNLIESDFLVGLVTIRSPCVLLSIPRVLRDQFPLNRQILRGYPLVMTNSSPWKDPPSFKFGKPSINLGKL